MHGVDCHEERLHRRVVGNAATPLGVTLHAIDEDLDATSQSIQELLFVVRLSVLVFLQHNMGNKLCFTNERRSTDMAKRLQTTNALLIQRKSPFEAVHNWPIHNVRRFSLELLVKDQKAEMMPRLKV